MAILRSTRTTSAIFRPWTMQGFIASYRQIIGQCCALLKPDRFACFVVGDFRDSRGFYRNFVSDTIAAFEAAGAHLYNEAVLVTALGSLPIRIGKQFGRFRKLGKTHQNVLVFYNGEPRAIPNVLGECEFGNVDESSETNWQFRAYGLSRVAESWREGIRCEHRRRTPDGWKGQNRKPAPAVEAGRNPSGRPKKLPITDRYAVMAELPAPDYLLAALKLSEAEKPAIKNLRGRPGAQSISGRNQRQDGCGARDRGPPGGPVSAGDGTKRTGGRSYRYSVHV